MSKKRHKGHGEKREPGGFVALPHAVLRSSEFSALSALALKGLLDLLAQYRGDNNGDLCATWSIMAKRGWRSRDSLGKAFRELREAEFVIVTRQGGRHRASLYGVTFYAIDWCGGKLDIKAPTKVHMGAWRKSPVALTPVLRRSPSPATLLSRSTGQLSTDCTDGSVTLREAA